VGLEVKSEAIRANAEIVVQLEMALLEGIKGGVYREIAFSNGIQGLFESWLEDIAQFDAPPRCDTEILVAKALSGVRAAGVLNFK
jgi:hypothetical protein